MSIRRVGGGRTEGGGHHPHSDHLPQILYVVGGAYVRVCGAIEKCVEMCGRQGQGSVCLHACGVGV